MMSKNYMLPSNSERGIDFTLYGSKDLSDTGVKENVNDNSKLSNIIQISSEERNIYNDGVINYNTRYIQRSHGSIKQASMIDNEAAAKKLDI